MLNNQETMDNAVFQLELRENKLYFIGFLVLALPHHLQVEQALQPQPTLHLQLGPVDLPGNGPGDGKGVASVQQPLEHLGDPVHPLVLRGVVLRPLPEEASRQKWICLPAKPGQSIKLCKFYGLNYLMGFF